MCGAEFDNPLDRRKDRTAHPGARRRDGRAGPYTRRTMEWVIIGIVVLIVLVLIVIYNSLVRDRNRVDNAWSQMEVQLKRRYDLIPNLVETVKGYASHEQQTFERVTQARSAAQSAQGPAEQAEAENFLTSALRQLFAVAEAYPELRASENFQGLQTELSDTENRIAVSRQIYNDSVLTYNNRVQQVPTNLVASMFGFGTREFFDAGEEAEEAPAVEF
jgi:LemA protein